MADSFFSNRPPRGPNPHAFTRDAIDEQLSHAELRRPVRVLIPSELFTPRVASAGPALADIAAALVDDMLERAQTERDQTRHAQPHPIETQPNEPSPDQTGHGTTSPAMTEPDPTSHDRTRPGTTSQALTEPDPTSHDQPRLK